jgi:hypothetical protein
MATVPVALGAAEASSGPAALWDRIVAAAEPSPRDQAMVEAFEAVGWDGVTLTVRRTGAGGIAGTAIQDMLASLASRAEGRPVRVAVRGGAPDAAAAAAPRRDARRDSGPEAPAVTVVSRPAAPRGDDGAVSHPLVRAVAELFDATVVRIEAAGTISAQATDTDAAAPAPGRSEGGAPDDPDHGEDDV